MKKLYLFSIAFLLTSCSESISIFVKIFGLDDASEKLEIAFDFNRFAKEERASVEYIKIYQNDSLIYRLGSASKAITTWKFPEVPKGFKIDYPVGANAIRTFSKMDKLRFEFAGYGKYPAYGAWEYQPKYATQAYRWLFDEDGNKKINIDCYYESWIGRDILKVEANNNIEIDPKSFQIYDSEKKVLEFELKSKKNLKQRFALALKQGCKKDEVLILTFKSTKGEQYEEQIIVPDKSNIGIAGKYSDL